MVVQLFLKLSTKDIASLIRTRLSDLFMTRNRHFRKPLDTTVPQDENLPTCAVSPRTTDVQHPGASTLISAPMV